MKPNKHQMFKVLVLLTLQDSEHCVAPNIPASTNKQSGKLLYSGTHITPFFDRFQSLLIFFRPRSPLLQSAKRIPEWRTAQHLRGQFSPPECLLSTEFKPRYTAEGATFSVRCSLTAWAEVERQGLGQGRFQHGGRHNRVEQQRLHLPGATEHVRGNAQPVVEMLVRAVGQPRTVGLELIETTPQVGFCVVTWPLLIVAPRVKKISQLQRSK
eukprot:EG_transcript_11975